MSTTSWIVLLSGLGTFALRWLPWRRAMRPMQPGVRWRGQHLLQRALGGVGPAAVAALLLVSLWGLVEVQDTAWRPLLAGLGGLLVVAGVRRLLGGMAWPTLLGALCYGGLMQLLG